MTVVYTLMNKNTPVLEFEYDAEFHMVSKINTLYHPEYAPLGVLGARGEITKRSLHDWWRERAVPASRHQIRQILDALSLDSTLALAERNFGLSLSDQYWINDVANPQQWKDINFFTNAFSDDLGYVMLGQESPGNPNLMSPNSTLGGDLRKKWVIIDGERVLVKEGLGLANQEAYNEVIASGLFEKVLSPGDFVPYVLHSENRKVYCACANMLNESEELIPAYDVIRRFKQSNNHSDYQHLVSCLHRLGVPNAETGLAKMLTCDYILANRDRHWRNFGIIRNVETLECTRLALIFDTGSCLWSDRQTLEVPKDFEYVAKPFGRNGMVPRKQLELLSDFEWLDPERFEDVADLVASGLSQNEILSTMRIDTIKKEVSKRIETVLGVAARSN